MARYIDADAVLMEIYHRANQSSVGEITTPYLDWKDVTSIIEEAPTVDVVEVVRCKDCIKHRTLDCELSKWNYRRNTKNTDFCSYGERQEKCC